MGVSCSDVAVFLTAFILLCLVKSSGVTRVLCYGCTFAMEGVIFRD